MLFLICWPLWYLNLLLLRWSTHENDLLTFSIEMSALKKKLDIFERLFPLKILFFLAKKILAKFTFWNGFWKFLRDFERSSEVARSVKRNILKETKSHLTLNGACGGQLVFFAFPYSCSVFFLLLVFGRSSRWLVLGSHLRP